MDERRSLVLVREQRFLCSNPLPIILVVVFFHGNNVPLLCDVTLSPLLFFFCSFLRHLATNSMAHYYRLLDKKNWLSVSTVLRHILHFFSDCVISIFLPHMFYIPRECTIPVPTGVFRYFILLYTTQCVLSYIMHLCYSLQWHNSTVYTAPTSKKYFFFLSHICSNSARYA